MALAGQPAGSGAPHLRGNAHCGPLGGLSRALLPGREVRGERRGMDRSKETKPGSFLQPERQSRGKQHV